MADMANNNVAQEDNEKVPLQAQNPAEQKDPNNGNFMEISHMQQ